MAKTPKPGTPAAKKAQAGEIAKRAEAAAKAAREHAEKVTEELIEDDKCPGNAEP
jgi:hypothetical protein